MVQRLEKIVANKFDSVLTRVANENSVLTLEAPEKRESESSRPIFRSFERNAMVAFALRKISRETENKPAQTDDREILRNIG